MKERCVGASKHHLHDSPRAPVLKQSAALKLPPFSRFVPPVKSELFPLPCFCHPRPPITPPITPPIFILDPDPFFLSAIIFVLIAHLSLSHLGCLCVLAEKEPSCVQRRSSWCPRLCFASFFYSRTKKKEAGWKSCRKRKRGH